MQIAIDAIVNKLMKEMTLTEQHKHNPQKVREHLTAVRALCDLVLEENMQEVRSAPLTESNPVVTQTMTPKYLQENDANGGSLLDF
ncbi:YwdI family protein [Ectobacillus antri]|uniref:YwdI family protein n=1 Tax=Ectobacillus antri TaxID=2486280 RepID=A0ABT6H5R9_9BACI|nr:MULTISPECIES: YwdI family protein [Ectobacillus]MDG4657688.1 YwdI family protein [Ectobacillus antri]MDG5754695.1 YwdI family protein [Ectobacillus antri]UOY91285.1 YwdI family protein [Ectobacillus sp. JY-23]